MIGLWRRLFGRPEPVRHGPVVPDLPMPAPPSAGANRAAVARATPAGTVGCELMDIGFEGGQRLPYADAARRFVAWMQDNDETGETTVARLRLLYAKHCAEDRLAVLPEGPFLAALGTIASRHRREMSRDGRMRKTTTYNIPQGPVVRAMRRTG